MSSYIGEPTFATHWLTCPFAHSVQDDLLCIGEVPEGYQDTVCIYRDGDKTCSIEGYPKKFVVYGGVIDNRNCIGDCNCTVDGIVTCQGPLGFYDDAQCTNQVAQLDENSTCPNISSASHVRFDAVVGGCTTDSTWVPDGDAVPSEPVTWCCTKPITLPSTEAQP